MEVIRLLTDGVLHSNHLDKFSEFKGLIDLQTTGSGYYVTLKADFLPRYKCTYSEPWVFGEYDPYLSGFIVYLEKQELTIECHAWGSHDLPINFRELDVKIYSK